MSGRCSSAATPRSPSYPRICATGSRGEAPRSEQTRLHGAAERRPLADTRASCRHCRTRPVCLWRAHEPAAILPLLSRGLPLRPRRGPRLPVHRYAAAFDRRPLGRGHSPPSRIRHAHASAPCGSLSPPCAVPPPSVRLGVFRRAGALRLPKELADDLRLLRACLHLFCYLASSDVATQPLVRSTGPELRPFHSPQAPALERPRNHPLCLHHDVRFRGLGDVAQPAQIGR